MESELTDLSQRWKQIGLRIVVYGWTFGRDRMSRSEEPAIRYPSRGCGDRANPYARIDVGIVRLIGTENLAAALQCWKWTTSANDSATLSPVIKFYRRRLTALSGVRERENNWLAHVASHVANDPFGEGVWLS